MSADLLTKRIWALSQWQTCLRVLPTRWRQKSTGIDMEQNYATVTLCINGLAYLLTYFHHLQICSCTPLTFLPMPSTPFPFLFVSFSPPPFLISISSSSFRSTASLSHWSFTSVCSTMPSSRYQRQLIVIFLVSLRQVSSVTDGPARRATSRASYCK